jgi:hypothetical protein
VKDIFKYLYYRASFDRLIILLASVSLVVALVSAGQVKATSIRFFLILIIILFVHLAVSYRPRSSRKSSSDCYRGQETMNIMVELANKMNVKLHPTKSLEIVPGLRNAKAAPRPFFSGHRVHFGGTVQIGCTILCGLTNPALKSVLAHELAHLRKRHLVRYLLSLLVFIPVLVYGFLSRSVPIIPIVLTFTIWGLVFSLISWRNEYEADAIAAEYVGKRPMADALEEIARLLHRTRDTITHPSFKKRNSRLLSGQD